jgi:hypothetical protein
MMNILHWAQMVRSGLVSAYDFGDRDNRKHYGSREAPIYDLSKDNAYIHLYWSPTDWLADQLDIEEYLIPTLQKQYLVVSLWSIKIVWVEIVKRMTDKSY